MNEAEELLGIHLTELGLPFERQYPYAKGRRLRADFALLDSWLLIEITGGVYHGGAHGSVEGVLRDIDRLNAATLNLWRVLRFTPDQVKDGTAIATISRTLGAFALEEQARGAREPTT